MVQAFIDKMVAEAGETLRGNRFKMKILFPAILAVPDAISRSEFNCLATEAPGATIGTLEKPIYGGHKLKVPGNKVIPDWSCQLRLDGDLVTYRAIIKWIEYADSIATGLRAPDISVFGGAEIKLYSGSDEVKQTWLLKYIFPTDPGPLSFSKEDADAEITQDISWTINDILTNTEQG